jgi:uncharacterized protein (TIGR04255 family)
MIPEILSRDAILEVNFEIRFEPSQNSMPEIILGRLSEPYLQKGFSVERLPIGEIPQAVRDRDASLQYQPLVRLHSKDSQFRVSVGNRSYNFAVVRKYCGWKELIKELRRFIQHFFQSNIHTEIQRLGLRYQNALTSPDHCIESLFDLNVELAIAGEEVSTPVSITYTKQHTSTLKSICRIVSSEYVQGDVPKGTSALIDIDMFSDAFGTGSEETVLEWAEVAHQHEKLQFFSILPTSVIQKLEIK